MTISTILPVAKTDCKHREAMRNALFIILIEEDDFVPTRLFEEQPQQEQGKAAPANIILAGMEQQAAAVQTVLLEFW